MLDRCYVNGCDARIKALGYCSAHYQRHRKHGDPLGGGASKNQGIAFLRALVANPPADKCVVWPFGKASGGYGYIRHQGKNWNAHALALFLYTGEKPVGMVAAHGPCHNPLCVNPHPDHGLAWATKGKNQADRLRDGTDQFGEKNGSSILTESDVLEIYSDHRSYPVIAEQYRTSTSNVHNIKAGNSWAWLTNASA